MLVKVCNQIVRPLPMTKEAAEHARKVVPVDEKNFRYLRFRAIGNMEWPTAGPNGNHDGFPYVWFEDERPGFGYKSFVNKRAHVEHNSADGLRGSIGDLPDAYLNRFDFGDTGHKRWDELEGAKYANIREKILALPNQRDGAIEVLMRIDTELVKSADVNEKTKKLLGRIIRMIDTGQMLTCSMGANIAYSYCSTCGNRAQFSNQYCDHMKPGRKGGLSIVTANQVRDLLDADKLRPEWLKHTVASSYDVQEILKGSSNKGIAVRNVELNHEVSFFELSVVAMAAFPEAKLLEKLARRQDEERPEYLKRLRAELGDDNILDLYSLFQEEGIISRGCEVR